MTTPKQIRAAIRNDSRLTFEDKFRRLDEMDNRTALARTKSRLARSAPPASPVDPRRMSRLRAMFGLPTR